MKRKNLVFLFLPFFLIFIFPLLFPSQVAHADLGADVEKATRTFKEYLRPYMDEYLGKETTLKLLGEPPETIVLPKIPQVTKDAKSLAGLEKKIDIAKEIPKDKRDQYNFQFIKELYEVTLNRAPSEEEQSKWLNTLDQGASLEGIYRAIVLSSAYDELEKFKDPPTENLLNFTDGFLKKYINLKVGTDALNQMNIHSIKRICVEKSLELMDVFTGTPDSLYDWYAVLSGELAKNHPKALDGELRKNPSLAAHRKWATTMPVDFLKSEIIIKLHKTFNSLI